MPNLTCDLLLNISYLVKIQFSEKILWASHLQPGDFVDTNR